MLPTALLWVSPFAPAAAAAAAAAAFAGRVDVAAVGSCRVAVLL